MQSFICILCPRGCHLQIDETTLQVSHHNCKRGEAYAKSELVRPVRVLTTTVSVRSLSHSRCSVKSDRPLDKSLLFACMKVINAFTAAAPIHMGDILIENICGSGCNIVATAEILK